MAAIISNGGVPHTNGHRYPVGLWLQEGDSSDNQWKVILSHMPQLRLNAAVFVNEHVEDWL